MGIRHEVLFRVKGVELKRIDLPKKVSSYFGENTFTMETMKKHISKARCYHRIVLSSYQTPRNKGSEAARSASLDVCRCRSVAFANLPIHRHLRFARQDHYDQSPRTCPAKSQDPRPATRGPNK